MKEKRMLKREEIISLLLYMLKNFLISQNKNESITLFCFAYFDKFRSRRCMRILSCTLFLFFTFFLKAVPSDVIFLWPGEAPGEKKGEIEAEFEKPPKDSSDVLRISNVSKPSMKIFPADPKNANGTAVLVCPGGGYSILAYEHEGLDVCEWLNSFGVTAILLKYRVPRRKVARSMMPHCRTLKELWGLFVKMPRPGILLQIKSVYLDSRRVVI
jgi:hypothetical protein